MEYEVKCVCVRDIEKTPASRSMYSSSDFLQICLVYVVVAVVVVVHYYEVSPPPFPAVRYM